MGLRIRFASVVCLLFAVNGAANAASSVFTTPSTSFVVTEGHAPTGTSATVYNGAVSYTQGLWSPGGVTSAILTLYLKDDVSSNLVPFVDLPTEWAKLTSVNDGSAFLASLPGSVEVDPNPFAAGQVIGSHTVTAFEALTANSLGAENLFGRLPTVGAYFDLDVTSLLNASNTGLLEFTLGVDAQYADLIKNSPQTGFAYLAISQLLGTDPGQFYMIEDFIFDHASLAVNYASEVPEPSVLMLLAVGIIGIKRFNKSA